MTEKIIGKKVFTLYSDWTAFDGYVEKPMVFTTETKAVAEMKKQVKSFVKVWKSECDISDRYAFAYSGNIDDCSWTISETHII